MAPGEQDERPAPSDCSCLQVAELARRLWSEGGEQWLQENRMNDQQLKDELDFMCEEPAHYPPGLQRFNLGKNHMFFYCVIRKLIQSNEYFLIFLVHLPEHF